LKVLIIGGSGVIGWNLLTFFQKINLNIVFTYFENKISFEKAKVLDITNKEQVIRTVNDVNPDLVIHTAGLTNVDLCETNQSLADSINVEGTKNIVLGCKDNKSKLVFVSTSFVFDGKKSGYSEDDQTSPSTYYGITKFRGEEIVKNSGLNYLILRTDQPYCWIEKWQHSNSVIRVLNKLQKQENMHEVVDWYNTPTYVPDFVFATKKLIDANESGIYHVVGSDYLNRYEWALNTAEIFNLNKNLLMSTTSDKLDLPAKRVNVNLSNNKLFEKTGVRMKGIQEGLKEMLKNKI